jgi:hypothetical protein
MVDLLVGTNIGCARIIFVATGNSGLVSNLAPLKRYRMVVDGRWYSWSRRLIL